MKQNIKQLIHCNKTHLLIEYTYRYTIGVKMSEDKIIVTISGKDGIGIVAEISTLLAKYEVNIEDIRQTIMQGCFMMFLLADISKSKYSFKEIKEALTESGKKLGMEIWTQKKEIFDKMHTI